MHLCLLCWKQFFGNQRYTRRNNNNYAGINEGSAKLYYVGREDCSCKLLIILLGANSASFPPNAYLKVFSIQIKLPFQCFNHFDIQYFNFSKFRSNQIWFKCFSSVVLETDGFYRNIITITSCNKFVAIYVFNLESCFYFWLVHRFFKKNLTIPTKVLSLKLQ